MLVSLLSSACNTPPPRTWLRYQPAGPTNWTMDGSGKLVGRLHGADVSIDLNRTQTRLEVVVENGTTAPVEFRMGPDGGAPRSAIGEVLLRPLGGPPGVVGPDMMPYAAMKPVVVEGGWRGTFYIDAPLGRQPGPGDLGQYFVFTVEARNAGGTMERRTLPLVAANAGTMPADGH
ncbi:MAG TPA: hypothetical protein VFZ65_09555 [Planctomycetota bacterium]|nr:hypothetical protein [Planctomycetota bacterium]